MKKHLSIILAALMISALFCGCTRTNGNGTTGTTATPGNTPNTATGTPNNGVHDNEPNNTNDHDGIIGDIGDAAGNVVGDVGNAVEDIGEDIAGNNNNNNTANTEPTAGGANGVRTKQ
ncbi:MAG: hypothetical protein PUB32_04370 [Clostridiales bacterium]|nr:hypothetical protein [Clostridiales bacterium]